MESGKDRISELPDGILHNIIHRLSNDEAAQTVFISRRWETLWRSYPFVEFDIYNWRRRDCNRDFQKFAEATINRFTRDSLLRMEILKLSLELINKDSVVRYSPLVEQLVDLASRRKAEEVSIFASVLNWGSFPRLCLPCRLLSDSAAKILQLKGIELKRVVLEDERILESLIASSPLLETMDLFHISNLSKLQVSNVPKLRTLYINYCEDLKEIEIAAPRLHFLHFSVFRCKIEITAPQLHLLEISDEEYGTLRDSTTLRLSVPKLEELTLINPYGLSNIHIDAGPDLTKFSVEYDESCPKELQKCEINHAGACRWELYIATDGHYYSIDPQLWFPQFKNFMVRCPQFRTVYIDRVEYSMITFDQNEVDNSVH